MRSRIIVVAAAALMLVAAISVPAIVGQNPRLVVTRAASANGLDTSTASWSYNAEQNLCYPLGALGLAGWVRVDTCPAGSVRGYIYNPLTFECMKYPAELAIGVGAPWIWRPGCPGPGAPPPACPDPRTLKALLVTGIVKADGLALHALQGTPGADTACEPGELRVAADAIYVCVATDAWWRAVLSP
jgi:hypothetical protein